MAPFTVKFDAKVIGAFITGTLINVTNNININYKTVTITSDDKAVSCACSRSSSSSSEIKRSDWIYDFLAA
jgi:phage-related protein